MAKRKEKVTRTHHTNCKRSAEAIARADRMEQMLEELLDVLGARDTLLPMGQVDIEGLYQKAYRTMKQDIRLLPASEVMWWAKTLLAVDASYLQLAAYYLHNTDPWYPLLWFADLLMEKAPRNFFKQVPELDVAYAYFNYARRSLRQVAYFYCRVLKGKKAADAALPESQSGDVTRGLSRLLTMALADGLRTDLGKSTYRLRHRAEKQMH
jgi:hypothetical protein